MTQLIQKSKILAKRILIAGLVLGSTTYIVTQHSPEPAQAKTQANQSEVDKIIETIESESEPKEEAPKEDQPLKEETQEEPVQVEQNQEPVSNPEPAQQPALIQTAAAPVPPQTSINSMQFRLNNGSYVSGEYILGLVHANPNAHKLWSAFNDRFGQEVADTAGISLFYENGTFWELTTGVCNAKHWINGDYRNCNYADMNSEGFDAGLKQINTYYQRYRIPKLGGPACEPVNSRDRTDACTQSQIAWLHNVDNNIAIALDLYAEQGFTPWYGYRRAFNK